MTRQALTTMLQSGHYDGAAGICFRGCVGPIATSAEGCCKLMQYNLQFNECINNSSGHFYPDLSSFSQHSYTHLSKYNHANVYPIADIKGQSET